MAFQQIFEIQQKMTVNNRRIVGQQVTRAGYMNTAQYLTAVPWQFTVIPHNFLYYPKVRNIIQGIDNLDRQLPETIIFNSSLLSWFTSYQGDLNLSDAQALTLAAVPAANSQTITVGNLPSVSSTAAVFRAGDFLQLGSYSYKVSADVLRGSGSTVSVNLNRPVIGTVTTGTLTAVANNCTFTVVAEQCPTYTLNPMTNGAFVEWSGPFVFREYVTG